MRDTDLLRRLKTFDLDVTEVDGWRTRGASTLRNGAHLTHHTAGSRRGTSPSLKAVINGLNRPDLGYYLPGPLSQTYTSRANEVFLVAAGTSNHAGKGGKFGLSGNSMVEGTEHEHCGYPDEPVTEERFETVCRVAAAHALGAYGAERCIMHYEWTDRKIDFVKQLNLHDRMRGRVKVLLEAGGARPVPYEPKEEEELMAVKDEIIQAIQADDNGLPRLMVLTDAGTVKGQSVPAGTFFVCSAFHRRVVSGGTANLLRWSGLVQNADPLKVEFAQIGPLIDLG